MILGCDQHNKSNLSPNPNTDKMTNQNDWMDHGQGAGFIFARTKDKKDENKGILSVLGWTKENQFKEFYNIRYIDTKLTTPGKTDSVYWCSWIPSLENYCVAPIYRNTLEFYNTKGKLKKTVHIPFKEGKFNGILKSASLKRIDLSQNGKFAVTVWDTEEFFIKQTKTINKVTIAVINCQTGDLTWVGDAIAKQSIMIRSSIISNNGKYVAFDGFDHGVAVYDTEKQKLLWQNELGSVRNLYVAFSNDNKFVFTGGFSGIVYKLDAKNGRLIAKYGLGENGTKFNQDIRSDTSCLAISPNGKLLASSCGDGIYIWDIESDKLIKRFQFARALCIQFSPDSRSIALVNPGRYLVRKIK